MPFIPDSLKFAQFNKDPKLSVILSFGVKVLQTKVSKAACYTFRNYMNTSKSTFLYTTAFQYIVYTKLDNTKYEPFWQETRHWLDISKKCRILVCELVRGWCSTPLSCVSYREWEQLHTGLYHRATIYVPAFITSVVRYLIEYLIQSAVN